MSDTLDNVVSIFQPLEKRDQLFLLTDNRTGAKFVECHIRAEKLIELGTTDAPLDPEEQGEFRANREIVENAAAYSQMKADALQKRAFSNIVAEYNVDYVLEKPLKIVGGQHRFEAVRLAFLEGINEYHGIKLYFDLTLDQRLDVQLISNTNIAISSDLFDRMQETFRGPELRNWCSEVGILEPGQDFGDRKARGGPITVQFARTFISNFYLGKAVDPKKFDQTETNPIVCPGGAIDDAWDVLRSKHKNMWTDDGLKESGKQYARLVASQRSSFVKKKGVKVPPDFPEKATNMAVLAGWSFVAGVLQHNSQRLKRHYALADTVGRDPLNASALAKGRHKTDPENYRGLGYRVDPKERARFAELFWLQAEDGCGVTATRIDVAIKQYHAKQAIIEVAKAKQKGKS